MANTEAAVYLRANLAKLAEKDQSFASSLLDQFDAKGRLSERQWYWIEKLQRRAMAADNPAPIVFIDDFAPVLGLFQQGSAKLKHPKIRLQLGDGAELCLSVAGPRSRRPGTVNLTDGGGYGAGIWYGRITREGAYERSENADDAQAEAIIALLRQLAADPAGTAAAYGKRTGGCCFCRAELSDARSVFNGYGATCAKNWGMPYRKPVLQADLL